MSETTTRAPSAPSWNAMCWPMPEPAPVTIATLLVRGFVMTLSPLVNGLRANEAKTDLRAETEHVAELDVEVAEGLDKPRVRERSRIDGVEADRTCEVEDRALCLRVVANHEGGKALVA